MSESYEDFVKKFKIKKTTDDCYTPPAVFDAVVDFVGQHYDLTGKNIVRPFFPGGDYERFEYKPNDVVIDNPPFSIISKITRFFIARKIPFFIFAPHLTLFTGGQDCTYVVCSARIVYDNGAVVRTSFRSNMFGDVGIMTAPELYDKIKEIQKREKRGKVKLPKYQYPINVITAPSLDILCHNGQSVNISKNEMKWVKEMKSQRGKGKGIFGSGFLVSDQAASEIQGKKEEAREAREAREVAKTIWELSPEEREIIEALRRKE